MLKRSLVRSVVVCCLLLAGLAAHGHSQESKPEKNEQIVIHHLRSHPAQIAAETLSLALGQHANLSIVPDQLSNVLILRGSEDTLKQCEGILEALDQPRRIIHFDVVISVVDSETAADQESKPGSTDRFQFATLDHNQARFTVGQRVAVASGTVSKGPGHGPPSKSFLSEQVGTMLIVTPRVAGEEISVDFQFEKSWVVQPPVGYVAVGSSPSVSQALMTSTLSLKPGVADTILATMSTGASSGENVSITITASLDHPKEH